MKDIPLIRTDINEIKKNINENWQNQNLVPSKKDEDRGGVKGSKGEGEQARASVV